ncbi:hypothetical protein [Actinoplanes sp. L3-i22]|uniref:hypothetical protein n=1 Tax=Actinoplanes sp. L3-i22 TaxID=2836373 RepID=UPI001C76BB3B|nr:hypothetical protein [Actinoplanes sp. L3-i22]BCY08289.1 hypothetical protein L3i22_033770 [Actinoplanes sp. L3-i22]
MIKESERSLGVSLTLAVLVAAALGLVDTFWGLGRHVPPWLVRTACSATGCGNRSMAVLGWAMCALVITVSFAMWLLWRRREMRLFARLLPGAVLLVLLGLITTTSKDKLGGGPTLAEVLATQPGAPAYLTGVHVGLWSAAIIILAELVLWICRDRAAPSYIWMWQAAQLATPPTILIGALFTTLLNPLS